jgi:acetyl esterase/lipase
MKTKLLPFVALLFFSMATFAQEVRFYDKVFQDVKKDSNIVYGSNYTYNFMNVSIGLTKEDQTIDIYQPVGDTATLRPLIIWAHGGSFMGGTKDDADIVHFCNEFAKRGFVTASINYRLGFELPVDSVEAVRTVYRSLQDGRAAVRYMRSIADSLNIDTSRVYFVVLQQVLLLL